MKPTPEAIETLTDAGYKVVKLGRCWQVIRPDGWRAHPQPYASPEWINNLAKEIGNEKTMD